MLCKIHRIFQSHQHAHIQNHFSHIPLAATITIPSSSVAPARNTPDADLCASIPQYLISEGYVCELMIHEVNSDRTPEIFERVSGIEEIVDELRVQFANYTRQISPFDRYQGVSPLEYWTKISYPDGNILGYLALKLYRVFPSSIAEERTVSEISKLNAPYRGRQKASALVHNSPVAPTVRFRNISELTNSAGKVSVGLRGVRIGSSMSSVDTIDAEVHNESAIASTDDEDSEAQVLSPEEWDWEAGFDEVIEKVEGGSRVRFEVDGINLADPLLIDLLSNEPVPGAMTRGATRGKKCGVPSSTGLLTTERSRKQFAPESFQF